MPFLAPPLAPPHAPSDADLLAATARGDRGATGELVRRYVDFVYAAAVRQTGDRHTAEDVTQTVFLVLSAKAGRVRAAALPAWLHRTTRYAAANARRAQRRRRFYEQAAARPESVMPYVLPEPDPLLPLLDDAIARLGRRDRRAVIARYLRGQDVAAVADALGVTPAAAQKRLERAVAKLRRIFARLGYREAAMTTATLAAVLAGASTAHAAPPGLTATVTGAASHSTAPAVLTVKGVLAMLTGTPVKVAAAILVGVVALGGAAVQVARVAEARAATPANGPATGPTDAAAHKNAAAAEDFPFAVGFKPERARFAGGDAITITTIDGTGPDLRGGIVRVTGTYVLASHDTATLAGSVTATDPADARGPWNDAQTIKIAKGHGTFKLLLPISVRGESHISFYDAATSFAGVYLKDLVPNPQATQPWSVHNDLPRLAPFTAVRWNGEAPEVRIGVVWYGWTAIDKRPVEALIADAKALDPSAWQKRISEDLVELSVRSGHPLGATVTLDLRALDGGAAVELHDVPMTAENRRAALTARVL